MLRVSNVTKKFGETYGLKDVSFQVPLGSIAALMGPSGSGKSTLLRCLSRLEHPDGGKILFQSKSLEALSSSAVGMVFQGFYLFPHMVVLKNLVHAPVALKKMSLDQAVTRAKELLTQFGLLSKIKAYPGELSGGQKQRIAIARALMMDPELLLFDEPTSALDPEMVGEVATLIKDLKSDKRIIVMATHELRAAHQAADQVLFLDQGQLVEDVPCEAFFAHPKAERAQQFLKNFQI